METPKNRSTRRRSSLLNSSRSKSGSASKMVKTMIRKEEQRKQNHYKTAKIKRAEIFKKTRHIDDDDEFVDGNYEDLNIDNDSSQNDDVDQTSNEQNLHTIDEQENADQTKIVHQLPVAVENKCQDRPRPFVVEDITDANSTFRLPVKSSVGFGAKIANKISNIKNTFKSFVNGSGTKSNQSADMVKLKKQNLTMTAAATVNRPAQFLKSAKNSTRSLHEMTNSNVSRHLQAQQSSGRLNQVAKLKQETLARSNSVNMKPALQQPVTQHDRLRTMKKHDSLNSCLLRSSASNLLSSTRDCGSQLSLSSRTSSSNLNNKPAFKITKIKYDDRHLFSEVI